jgi:hypothetical protein
MKVKAVTIKEMNNPYFKNITFQAKATAKKQRILFILTTIGKNQA